MTASIGDAAILEAAHAAHAADSEYILRQYSTRGYQALSFVAPIAYTGYTIAKRKPWSLGQTLRATWAGGIGGAVSGAGVGWAWTSNVSPERVHATRIKIAYDRNLLRLNDHATIGMLLGGLLTPAIFLKRAGMIDLVLGGAGFGSSVGAGAHFWRLMTEPSLPAGPGPAVRAAS